MKRKSEGKNRNYNPAMFQSSLDKEFAEPSAQNVFVDFEIEYAHALSASTRVQMTTLLNRIHEHMLGENTSGLKIGAQRFLAAHPSAQNSYNVQIQGLHDADAGAESEDASYKP